MATIVLGQVEDDVVVAQASALEEKLATAVEESPNGLLIGLLHIEVDLQMIELVHGPPAKRLLIKEIQARLGGSVRDTDPKVNQADGTFAVVLPGLGTHDDLQLVAEGVHNALSVPYRLPRRNLVVDVHIGAAMCGHGIRNVRHCIKGAAACAAEARQAHVAIKIADGSVIQAISRRLHLRPSAPARKTDRVLWKGMRTAR